MAVQQRSVTKSTKGITRSHDALSVPNLTACKKCGTKIHTHRVCSNCGYYKEKKLTDTAKV